jgi:multiple sugar transport system substrate-binding protein
LMRMGNEHVMAVYVIWKFAKNKEAAQKFLVDQQLGYRQHFVRSSFYNFPAWTNAIKGGFNTIRKLTAQDMHKPRGKYSILTTIAEKYTTNVGHPGFSNAAVDEIFNTWLVPQMFAEVAQGKSTPAEAVSGFARKATSIYRKWKDQGLV